MPAKNDSGKVYFLSTEPVNDDFIILPAIDIDGYVVLTLYLIKLV